MGLGIVARVNSADLRPLQDGDLETREEYLYHLLDRCRTTGDDVAAEVLRTLARDYRSYHRSLYTRAMNQAGVFGDPTLEAPLLAALSDAVATLERMVAGDRGVTVFDGEVRVAAKKGLRTLRRIQTAIAGRASESAEAERSRSSRDG
jgi:hypothetical protein